MKNIFLTFIFLSNILWAGQESSPIGIELIKHYEGLHLRAYYCPAKILTIGYGHTGGVKPGQVITKFQAIEYLRTDMKRFESHINQNLTKPIPWYEFDALTSFCFNCGYQLKGKMKEAVNRSLVDRVCQIFRSYTHAKGHELPGLIRRRQSEIVLYREAKLNFEAKI